MIGGLDAANLRRMQRLFLSESGYLCSLKAVVPESENLERLAHYASVMSSSGAQ